MAARLTIKRERFAQVFVRTGDGPQAYRAAFDVKPQTKAASIRAEVAKLLANPVIALRIEQLRERIRKAHDLKVEDIMNELDENRDMALREGQSSAATQATMGKAKVAGFLIEKVQHEITFKGVADRMRKRRNERNTKSE